MRSSGERIRLGECPRAISGVPPENTVFGRDAEHDPRDADAPQKVTRSSSLLFAADETRDIWFLVARLRLGVS
jgi:hypothetical protein